MSVIGPAGADEVTPESIHLVWFLINSLLVSVTCQEDFLPSLVRITYQYRGGQP